MAQTVSLQRGSVTFTANGSSPSNITTLFTNGASGTATRVIVNYISLQNPYVNPSSNDTRPQCSGHLGVVNGSAAAIIGSMRYTSGGPDQGYLTATMPIYDNSQMMISAATTNQYCLPTVAFSAVSINQTGYVNQSPDNLALVAGSATVGGYCPRNFWIGPSDSVKWWPQTSNYTTPSGKSSTTTYNTMTLHYSFTLITES